jgi:mycothiol synthase
MSYDENNMPCLYLIWQKDPSSLKCDLPPGYDSRCYRHDDEKGVRTLLESDGWQMNNEEWQGYLDRILPKGLFLIFQTGSQMPVATAGAVHNPNPGRYYFPFGGELGYLIVHTEHRGRRLGSVISAIVVKRFLAAGYENIRVCVQGCRLPAIRTYLGVGFEPFLHTKEVEERWEKICTQINRPFKADAWPRRLNDPGLRIPAA